MDPIVVGTLGVTFVALLLIGAPVALALAGSTAVTVLAFMPPGQWLSLPMGLAGATDSHVLLAVPFFILAGTILAESALSRRLVSLAAAATRGLPGGLGVAVVVAGVFLAGISGSGPADVAILGAVMAPMLLREGYARGLVSGLIAVSGSIGIIIPPSIALLVYGAVAQGVSVERLFLGGVGPGLCMGLALSVAVVVGAVGRRRAAAAVAAAGHPPASPVTEPVPLGRALREAVWALVFPFIILGGIYLGVFTPTESAAVAVVYAVFVSGVVYRELTWSRLVRCLAEAAAISAGVMVLVAGASVFARLLAMEGVAQSVGAALCRTVTNRWALLAAVNLLVLVAGCLLDAISVFYILVPILLPALALAGFDPVHIGVILTVNLAVGQVTPPVAVNLFVSCAITRARIGETIRASWPLLAAAGFTLVVTNVFPALTLWLPNTMR